MDCYSQRQQRALTFEDGEPRKFKAICTASSSVNTALSPLNSNRWLRKHLSYSDFFFFLPMLFRISSVINGGTQFPRTLISLPKKRTTKFAKGDSSPLGPWNSHFIFLIPNTVKAKERESIWELKNKRAKISNNEKKKKNQEKPNIKRNIFIWPAGRR